MLFKLQVLTNPFFLTQNEIISHQTLYRQDNKISVCGNPFSFGVSAQFFPSLENLLRQVRSLTAQSCVQETIRELRQELKSRANSAPTPL